MSIESKYLSDTIKEYIWPTFSMGLKTKRARDNYYSVLCMICNYTKRDFLDITYTQAQEYFDYLLISNNKKKRLALSTVQSRLSMLNSFAKYIVENKKNLNIDRPYTNIYMYINIPEYDNYIKPDDIPSIEELNKLLEVSSDNNMMYLIFALVIKCAFSTSEICKMKESHIVEDLSGRFCVEINEYNKIRRVKLPDDIVGIIKDYMKYKPAGEYLFYNKKGLNLKVRNLESYCKKYMKMAELKKAYTLQDIRNAAICYMKSSGASDDSIAKYIGVDGRWMYRYDCVLEELDLQAVDYSKIIIKA